MRGVSSSSSRQVVSLEQFALRGGTGGSGGSGRSMRDPEGDALDAIAAMRPASPIWASDVGAITKPVGVVSPHASPRASVCARPHATALAMSVNAAAIAAIAARVRPRIDAAPLSSARELMLQCRRAARLLASQERSILA